MAADHVNQQDVEYHDLEDEIQPGHIADHCDKAGDDAGVEGENVGVLHQRQAELAEVIAEFLAGHAVLTVFLIQGGTQALHLGRQALLVGGIAAIEEQRQLAPEVPAPLQLMILLLELGSAVELTALLSLEEEEVELAVTVGHGSLQCMADAREDAQGPDQPLMLCKEMLSREAVTEVQFPEHQSKTDGSEPEVAAHAVEDASHAGVLLREACQLSIGAVKGIGPGDEQHTHPVEPSQIRLLEVEHDASRHTHEDASDGDGIGAYTQFLKQFCP